MPGCSTSSKLFSPLDSEASDRFPWIHGPGTSSIFRFSVDTYLNATRAYTEDLFLNYHLFIKSKERRNG